MERGRLNKMYCGTYVVSKCLELFGESVFLVLVHGNWCQVLVDELAPEHSLLLVDVHDLTISQSLVLQPSWISQIISGWSLRFLKFIDAPCHLRRN